MLVKIESLCRKTLNIKLGVFFLKLKEFGSSIRDPKPIISVYHMSPKLRGVPRLLFGNGCVWLDDDAE